MDDNKTIALMVGGGLVFFALFIGALLYEVKVKRDAVSSCIEKTQKVAECAQVFK